MDQAVALEFPGIDKFLPEVADNRLFLSYHRGRRLWTRFAPGYDDTRDYSLSEGWTIVQKDLVLQIPSASSIRCIIARWCTIWYNDSTRSLDDSASFRAGDAGMGEQATVDSVKPQQIEREAHRAQANRDELVERIARTVRKDGRVEPLKGLHLHRKSLTKELFIAWPSLPLP